MSEKAVTTLAVLITVDPADAETFASALREVHNQTKKLAELLFFDLCTIPGKPGTFHLVETWSKDMEYLQKVEFRQPYYLAYYAKTDHLLKDRRVEILEPLPGWTVNHTEPTPIG